MKYNRNNENMEQILLQHLRELADNDGYVTFSGRSFALDRGVSYTTIQNVINRLSGQGKLEYTKMVNKGIRVHLLKSEQPKDNLLKSEQLKDNLRKCPKCGETAHDANSRFCHRCGASLLTEKEQLKYRLDMILPRLYREIKDPAVANEAMELIGTLKNIVFKED